jgi:hypothetical protein
VLTEHREFNPELDYSQLAAAYDVLVLRGAELETDLGHVLVYGDPAQFAALARDFDFTNVALPARDLFRRVRELGMAAAAAHAGRPRIGLWEYAQRGVDLDGVQIIEQLNGGSSAEENARAAQLAAERGFFCVGGSDAHYVSAIGRCLTAFPRPIRSMRDLIEELYRGEYRAIRLEETRGRAGAISERG